MADPDRELTPSPASAGSRGSDAVRRRSLILAGGGYKVAFQAGVLQVWLDEAGLVFDHADGASGGNLNLAMWCQEMTGTQIADNWRNLPPRLGIGFNWREWPKLLWASSLLSLGRFRRNVLTRWGLDWDRIRTTGREATFNVYDFTRHELVPVPAEQMTEDLLIASISIPMWFPPVRIDGTTYIDAVFLSDGNLEEAARRGADEIWVIWTVSEKSEWLPGFIGNYFGIIETVANGNLRRDLKRIERSNAEIAAGRRGEYGKPIDVKILRAEVPLHYLVIFGANRVREAVNRGVRHARRWCLEQGIALRPPQVTEVPDATRLRFTEEMKGFIGLGETDFERGHAAGEAARATVLLHLRVALQGVVRFITDPEHQGQVDGYVDCDALGGRLRIESGVFNLFVDEGDPAAKQMLYRLHVVDPDGNALTLAGQKRVRDDPSFDVWSDTSTLYLRAYRGHVSAEQEPGAEVIGAGIVRIHLLDFLHELTTFDVDAASALERASVLAQFGQFFLGSLWDVYARRVLSSSPI